MAEIFVSHSKRDEDVRNFFSNVFAGLNVAGKFVEFEDSDFPRIGKPLRPRLPKE